MEANQSKASSIRTTGGAFEDYSTKPVPAENARGWFDIGIVILGIYVCIPLFMVGGILGNSGAFWVVVAAILIGQLILTIISLGTGLTGASTRMATAMTCQRTYGLNGNIIIAVLLALGTFGWFGFQLELFGQAIIGAVNILSSGAFVPPRWLVVIVGGILMTSTAMYGFKAIEKLTVIVIPVLILLFLVTLIKIQGEITFAEVVSKTPAQSLPLGVLISIVVGTYAVGAVIQPDLTRYSKSSKSAFWGIVFGMMICAPFIYILATYIGLVAGKNDFSAIMLSFHSGWWGLFAMFAIVVATWTSNDNNLYSAALAFNSMLPNLKKWQVTVIGGGLGTLMAIIGLVGQIVNWLVLLSATIPPIGAVMAADFLLFRRSHYTERAETGLEKVRWSSLLAWAIGVLVGFLTHFKVFVVTSAPGLDSMLAGFIAHTVIMLLTGNKIQVRFRTMSREEGQ